MDPARSSSPSPSLKESERWLRELPKIELLGLLRHSSNYTYLARLSDATHSLLAVYKPAAGESPLWDFTPATLYKREVAAYLLAKALGWPRVPPTVVREDAPEGPGSLQLFIEGDPRNHYLRIRDAALETWPLVALFDVLTNNADRKAGHCLMDPAGAVWVVDHGLTFHVQPKLRTIIWDYAGQRLPARLKPDLERVEVELDGDLGRQLASLLSRTERRFLRRRVAQALDPGWRFPYPTSNWSIPWPPV